MDASEIKKLILDYVKKEFIDDDTISLDYDMPLISGGLVDSFSMVSLLIYIENKFRIKIPPSKATPEVFDNVNSITKLVEEYIKV